MVCSSSSKDNASVRTKPRSLALTAQFRAVGTEGGGALPDPLKFDKTVNFFSTRGGADHTHLIFRPSYGPAILVHDIGPSRETFLSSILFKTTYKQGPFFSSGLSERPDQ